MAGGDGSQAIVGDDRRRARPALRLHPSGDAQPLRARPRGRPRRRRRRARRLRRRRRAPRRPGRGQRPGVREQRLARAVRRRGAATRIPGGEAAHAARHVPDVARAGRAAAPICAGGTGDGERSPRSRSWCPTTATVSVARSAQAPDRGSTVPSWGSRCWRRSPGPGWTPGTQAGDAPVDRAEFEIDAAPRSRPGSTARPTHLDPPLRFSIRPGALRVRIARKHPGASPSALEPDTAMADHARARVLRRTRRAAGREPGSIGRLRGPLSRSSLSGDDPPRPPRMLLVGVNRTPGSVPGKPAPRLSQPSEGR